MAANREYKDSLFSWLFSDPDTLRELYGALEGVTLGPDIPVTINTLEGVLFKARMNDISFVIGSRVVVLIEHQSTINENMPLRLLLYIAKIYESLTGAKDIYRERLIKLPRPEFIVLYNGAAPYADEKTLRLSEAFHEASGLVFRPKGEVCLELEVKVYNINEGHNGRIVKRSKTLEGYSEFVGTVRKKEKGGAGREEAIKGAVRECIERGVLKDFLESHAGEVVNMLMTEWNWEDAREVWEEEAREEGREEGREEDVKRLWKYGMTPEQIAEALELPPDAVRAYLKAE
jgi:hypothetical protein